MHQNVEAVGQVFNQLRGGVLGADIQYDGAGAQASGEGFQIGLGLGHVEQDHLRAVTGQGFGDGRADATGGAGDQSLAPRQRTCPVLHRGVAGLQTNHLA